MIKKAWCVNEVIMFAVGVDRGSLSVEIISPVRPFSHKPSLIS
jgi:hypothetical protein